MTMNAPIFAYDSYDVVGDNKELALHYHYEDADGLTIGRFTERYVLPVAINPDDGITQYILQQLHIIAGISYYKSLLGSVQVPYAITQAEADYYNTIFHEGLGEYSFVNQLTEVIKPFSSSQHNEPRTPMSLSRNQGAILGIGGGKDSIVAVEIAKGIGLDTTVLDIATRDHHGQAGAVMDKADVPQLRVGRYLDHNIVDFTNQQHGKHGHIPVSVLFAWLGTLLAYTTNMRYIMMANEAATAEGDVEWNGRIVNHQWAKSFEAEKLTQDFIHTNISPDLWYFSPIRAYGSLAIMELFVDLGKPYYQDFTSCNAVLRIDPSQRPNGRWCTRCAKCLSTWLLLSVKLPVSGLADIFGRNLFDDISLRPTLEALLGLSGHKPLDCVGTIDELRAATRLAIESGTDHLLLKGLSVTDIPGANLQALIDERANASVPPELIDDIGNYVSERLAAP